MKKSTLNMVSVRKNETVRSPHFYLMREVTAPQFAHNAVLDALTDLLNTIGTENTQQHIDDFGVFRTGNFKDTSTGELAPGQSIDWYVQRAKQKEELSGSKLIADLEQEGKYFSRNGHIPHYEIVLVQPALTEKNPFSVYVEPHKGIILSTQPFEELSSLIQYTAMKANTLHHLGLMMGLQEHGYVRRQKGKEIIRIKKDKKYTFQNIHYKGSCPMNITPQGDKAKKESRFVRLAQNYTSTFCPCCEEALKTLSADKATTHPARDVERLSRA